MKTLVPLGVLTTLTSGTGFTLGDAGARGSAGATIDRALVCSVVPGGGINAVKAGASSAQPGLPATASLSTGEGQGVGLAEILAAKYAGRPAGLSFNATLCHRTTARVPLAARGLSGAAAALGDDATCLAGKQVYVHLHVVLKAKPVWTSNPPNQIAHGKPLSAQIAMQSQKRKPLVYMTIAASKASFFSAKSCF